MAQSEDRVHHHPLENPRFDIRDYQVSEVPCGFVAVEIACVTSPDHPQQSLGGKKKKVSHYIRYFFGAMLPWHMMRSLQTEGLNPIRRGGFTSHSSDIFRALSSGRLVLAFLGCGIGHWVVLCDYDNEYFYMYDNRASIARDEFGISKMSRDEFFALWAEVPLWYKPVQWLRLSKYFPILKISPRTMIIPW